MVLSNGALWLQWLTVKGGRRNDTQQNKTGAVCWRMPKELGGDLIHGGRMKTDFTESMTMKLGLEG